LAAACVAARCVTVRAWFEGACCLLQPLRSVGPGRPALCWASVPSASVSLPSRKGSRGASAVRSAGSEVGVAVSLPPVLLCAFACCCCCSACAPSHTRCPSRPSLRCPSLRCASLSSTAQCSACRLLTWLCTAALAVRAWLCVRVCAATCPRLCLSGCGFCLSGCCSLCARVPLCSQPAAGDALAHLEAVARLECARTR
jgi:hypothetical protein